MHAPGAGAPPAAAAVARPPPAPAQALHAPPLAPAPAAAVAGAAPGGQEGWRAACAAPLPRLPSLRAPVVTCVCVCVCVRARALVHNLCKCVSHCTSHAPLFLTRALVL
eukprot:1157833-Pelagomonas_calceolata.AAC.6